MVEDCGGCFDSRGYDVDSCAVNCELRCEMKYEKDIDSTKLQESTLRFGRPIVFKDGSAMCGMAFRLPPNLQGYKFGKLDKEKLN